MMGKRDTTVKPVKKKAKKPRSNAVLAPWDLIFDSRDNYIGIDPGSRLHGVFVIKDGMPALFLNHATMPQVDQALKLYSGTVVLETASYGTVAQLGDTLRNEGVIRHLCNYNHKCTNRSKTLSCLGIKPKGADAALKAAFYQRCEDPIKSILERHSINKSKHFVDALAAIFYHKYGQQNFSHPVQPSIHPRGTTFSGL
ncbi:MAG: hypothetical protein ACRCWR_02285 [Saezia sp.]